MMLSYGRFSPRWLRTDVQIIHARCQCYMLDRCKIIRHAPSIHEGIILARYGLHPWDFLC